MAGQPAAYTRIRPLTRAPTPPATRGTVHSESKIVPLKQASAKFGAKLVIEGIAKPRPHTLNAIEPDEQIILAMNGTLRILEPTLAFETSVKHAVYVSTCGVICELGTTPRQFSETD
ncbi:uncharacterized protein B0H18DRAFT_1120420 [Fomitopsis serialis]|uniref:uncharacterized protein n=1 Tax=Fomitopsis serialis TaxID=139415 RepID=UPI002008B0C1|nr:uncharacterized protein B0H18DRAFT_1120420 [Neoantrodia serialis]KAH9923315.1 hypothetical protein B0H18DRAFT_1120420 [Neoantrodia serialis]